MIGERAVRQLAWRLRWACALRGAVWWSVLVLFLWGSAVVVARLVWQSPWNSTAMGIATATWWLIVGLAAVMVAAVGGAYRGLCQVPEEAQLLAWLDADNACGGLLMAAREVPLDGWTWPVRVERIPSVAWRKRKALALLAIAVAYVAAGLFLPQRYLRLVESPGLAAQRQAERLERQLEKLHELGLVTDERRDELRAELDLVRKNASAQEPGKTHEALDHLQQTLQQLAQEGVQKWLQERRQLQQAQELAEALKQLARTGEIPSPSAQLASQALHKLLPLDSAGASPKVQELARQVQELLAQHEAGSPFSDDELAKLSDLLQDLLDAEALDLDGLAELGLLDPEWLRQLKNARLRLVDVEWLKLCLRECEDCDGDPEALLVLLAKCRGSCSGDGASGLPDRGGVSRGRGDAPISFGKPSSAEGVQFQPQTLQPGALHHLEAPVLQVRRVQPTTEARETSQGGVLDSSRGTGEGYERQILPRHRRSVRQYFESGR